MEDLWTYHNRHQNRYKYRDAGLDDNLLRVMRAYYWACVSYIDYNVGRILDALEAEGELDNTLVVWSSDHGEFLGDYNCFGKRSFLDAAARVPLLARLPGRFPAGVQVDTPASLVDLMPTFACAAEADTNAFDLDGLDLAEIVDRRFSHLPGVACPSQPSQAWPSNLRHSVNPEILKKDNFMFFEKRYYFQTIST